MTLYEINQEIARAIEAMFDSVDEETGEIHAGTVEIFNNLKVARDEKIENIGVYMKNLQAEADLIKKEEQALKERRERKEKKYDRLKKYLTDNLDGNPWESSKVSLSFRISHPVEIDDESQIPEKYMKAPKIEDPKPDKTAISKAIKAGEKVPGAHIEEKKNLQIK
jgi:hypothetical protein